MLKTIGTIFAQAFLLVLISAKLLAQEWPHYGGDSGGSKYSPLDQINRGNVNQLKVAWTFNTGDLSDGTTYTPGSAFECTPVVIDGVMYLTTPFSRVIALEAETGKQVWSFDPKLDKSRPYSLFINRGVAFARVGRASRIFLGTLDGRLFALDACDGQPVKGFGNGGVIDLRVGVADKFPNKNYGMTSPPVVYKDLSRAGRDPRCSLAGERDFDEGLRRLSQRAGRFGGLQLLPRTEQVAPETFHQRKE